MSIADDTESYVLYHSPVRIQDEDYELRILSYYEGADQEEEADTEEGTNQEEAADMEAEADAGTADSPESEEAIVHSDEDGHSFELLGLWDGYDAHTGLPGRNVIPISELEGDNVILCDAVYSTRFNDISDYIDSMETQITKDSVVEYGELPEGPYKIRFVARDVFNNTHYSDYIDLYWDGEAISFE